MSGERGEGYRLKEFDGKFVNALILNSIFVWET